MNERLKTALKPLMRHGWFRALHRALRGRSRLARFLETLAAHGFAPALIYDIGANHGLWTRQALGVFPDAECRLFEPQDALRASVSDLLNGEHVCWIPKAVSRAPGTALFTLAARDDSSTLAMTAEQAAMAGFRQVGVALTSIDAEIEDDGGRVPDMIKIDAEGHDLEVLDGAVRALGETDVILIEAAVLGDAPNDLVTVCTRLAAAGYSLAQITDLNDSPRTGALWLVELAFLRCGSDIEKRLAAGY